MDEKSLKIIKQMLDEAENNIKTVRKFMFDEQIQKQAQTLSSQGNGEVVEGVFNGEEMVGPDSKKYPIPANYASKSKLVVGDVLKLTILEDGSFVFKQIAPVERKKLIGILEQDAESKYQACIDNKRYNLLLASVTYFKGKAGDKVTILLPKEGECDWAAVENIIPQ